MPSGAAVALEEAEGTTVSQALTQLQNFRGRECLLSLDGQNSIQAVSLEATIWEKHCAIYLTLGRGLADQLGNRVSVKPGRAGAIDAFRLFSGRTSENRNSLCWILRYTSSKIGSRSRLIKGTFLLCLGKSGVLSEVHGQQETMPGYTRDPSGEL